MSATSSKEKNMAVIQVPKKKSPWDAYYADQQGEGSYYGVGQQPGPQYLGQGTIPHYDGGFYGREGGDFAAGFNEANAKSEAAAQAALARLAAGQFAGGDVGQTAASRYMNPRGFGPEALAKQQRMAADNEAGSRENALESMKQAAYASGFGESMGLLDSMGNVRLRSASNLRDEQDRLFVENEKAKLAQEAQSGDLIARLLALEGEMNQSYADFQGRRKFPIAPSGTAGGGAPGALPGAASGWKYLNERGEMIPFHADGTPLNDWEKEQALFERQQWVRQYSGGG